MTNAERRQLLDRFRASGMEGSILDVYKAYEQGQDLIGEYEAQQQLEQPVVLETPEEQREGLRPFHRAGDFKRSAVFKDVPPNTPFNTIGMKKPINIEKRDPETGHLIESHKSVPPGIRDIPTGPHRGDVIETPAEGYKFGGAIKMYKSPYAKKMETGGEKEDQTQVTDPKKTFDQAFAEARKNLGPGKTFEYNDKIYSTDTADDLVGKTAQEKLLRNSQPETPDSASTSSAQKGEYYLDIPEEHDKQLSLDAMGYRVMVIQYPYGYEGGRNMGAMFPGHIEAVLVDKDGNYVNYLPDGRKGFVNRWRGSGNRPVYYDADTDYQDGVRTAILNLDGEELEHFVNTAQTFTPGETTNIPSLSSTVINMASPFPIYYDEGYDISTTFGGQPDSNYDFITSNCANGVCRALGMDEDEYTSLGITDPTELMDGIFARDDIYDSTGEKRTKMALIGEEVIEPVFNNEAVRTHQRVHGRSIFAGPKYKHGGMVHRQKWNPIPRKNKCNACRRNKLLRRYVAGGKLPEGNPTEGNPAEEEKKVLSPEWNPNQHGLMNTLFDRPVGRKARRQAEADTKQSIMDFQLANYYNKMYDPEAGGFRKEDDPQAAEFIHEMFSDVGLPEADSVNTPWSAATVSHFAKAFDPEFKGSPLHADYINRAFNKEGNYRAKKTSRKDEYALGDILFQGRGNTEDWEFKDFKRAGKDGERYSSHSDIIVGVGTDENGKFYQVLGGNLSDSTKLRKLYAKDIARKYKGAMVTDDRVTRKMDMSGVEQEVGENGQIINTATRRRGGLVDRRRIKRRKRK